MYSKNTGNDYIYPPDLVLWYFQPGEKGDLGRIISATITTTAVPRKPHREPNLLGRNFEQLTFSSPPKWSPFKMQIVLLQPLFLSPLLFKFREIETFCLDSAVTIQDRTGWSSRVSGLVTVMVSLSNIEHKWDLRRVNGLKESILHENVNTNDTSADVGLGNNFCRAASLIFCLENKEEKVLRSTE